MASILFMALTWQINTEWHSSMKCSSSFWIADTTSGSMLLMSMHLMNTDPLGRWATMNCSLYGMAFSPSQLAQGGLPLVLSSFALVLRHGVTGRDQALVFSSSWGV